MKIFGFLSREELNDRGILKGKIMGVLFALVGMIIFVYGYYQRSMANKSKSWSTIEGTIIYFLGNRA
jgi:hypothetical protein